MTLVSRTFCFACLRLCVKPGPSLTRGLLKLCRESRCPSSFVLLFFLGSSLWSNTHYLMLGARAPSPAQYAKRTHLLHPVVR